MKQRRVAIVLIFLLLITGGAIVNVAVAWTTAILVDPKAALSKQRHYSPATFHGMRIVDRRLWSVEVIDQRGIWRAVGLFGVLPRGTKMLQSPPDPAEVLPEWARDWVPSDAQVLESKGYNYLDARGWPTNGVCYEAIFPSVRSKAQYRWAIAVPSFCTTNAQTDRALPLKPLWPGFAINTLFYAAILWLLFALPGALRRWQRIKRGLCPACAYPVGTSPVCTECGKALPQRCRF